MKKIGMILALGMLLNGASAGAASSERQEGMLDINGASIHYVSQGSGTPLLFVHGYPLSGELFARNRDALAKAGFRVITIDHRGYGKSTAPANDTGSLATYAADALAVLDKLNVPKAIVGGMSMGGPITFEMYRRAPERFMGLILIDTIANPASIVEQGLWKGAAQKVQTFGPQSLAPELLKDMLTGETRLHKPADAKIVTDIMNQATLAAKIAGAKALETRPDSLPTLKTINVPTLIVEGVEDTVYPPEFSQKMQQNIAGSQLVLIPGAAHAPMFEKANEFNRIVMNWGRQHNFR